jgi:hypothetical protein
MSLEDASRIDQPRKSLPLLRQVTELLPERLRATRILAPSSVGVAAPLDVATLTSAPQLAAITSIRQRRRAWRGFGHAARRGDEREDGYEK